VKQLVVFLAVDAVFYGLFAWLSESGGLLSPDGVNPALVLLGVVVLVLRLVALFVLPPLIVYRLVRRALSSSPASPSAPPSRPSRTPGT